MRTFRKDLGSFNCRGCGERFYASQEAIEEARPEVADHSTTDAEIASTFEFCLDCAEGEQAEEERPSTTSP